MTAEIPGFGGEPVNKTEMTVEEFVRDDPEFSDKPEYMALGLLAAGVPLKIDLDKIDSDILALAKLKGLKVYKQVKRLENKLEHDRNAHAKRRSEKPEEVREADKLYKRAYRARKRANEG